MSNIAQADIYADLKEMQVKRFSELLKERYRLDLQFELPTLPVDQIFACGLYYSNTGQVSSSVYIFDFRDDGTLTLSFDLNNGQTVNGNGHYTARPWSGLTDFDANATYVIPGVGTFQAQYNLGNVQQTDALGMIRYFDATGELVENQSVYPVQMFCQAAGHRYNATSSPLRFVCPNQSTATGVIENTFEFNPAAPGQVFRQRDFYPLGSSNGIIERNQVGIYLRTGNDLQIDFTVNPTLRSAGVFSEFSDFNELNAHLQTNDGQLQMVVDEFPPGENICIQQ
ncbi:MAG: hypothetical protein ABW101_15085 [Candidatus Thiodiazotropha sp.]